MVSIFPQTQSLPGLSLGVESSSTGEAQCLCIFVSAFLLKLMLESPREGRLPLQIVRDAGTQAIFSVQGQIPGPCPCLQHLGGCLLAPFGVQVSGMSLLLWMTREVQRWEPQVRVREQETTHWGGCWDRAGQGRPNRFSSAGKRQVRSGSAVGAGPGEWRWVRAWQVRWQSKDSCCLGVFRKLWLPKTHGLLLHLLRNRQRKRGHLYNKL